MFSMSADVAYRRVTQAMFLVVLTGTLYGIFGGNALPGSELFAVCVLAVFAYAGGLLVSLFRLPPLVGMLAVGFLIRNVPFLSLSADISTECASTLRDVSLAIILLKAGLGLDADNLKVLKWTVLRLSLVPCLSEACSLALFSHYFLGLPWMWAFLLGFILSAVSAAILVPGALALEKKKLGSQQGIPTLLLASVSLDNVTALTGFIVLFNALTSKGNLTRIFCERLVEPFAGLLLGALVGILLWYFPNKEKSDFSSVVYYRSALMCLGGLSFMFVSKRLECSGVGALGCVSLAFVASLRWKKDVEIFRTLTWITGLLWVIIEPFLFGLIGAEVTIDSLQNNIGYGTLVLSLGMCVRVAATVLSLLGSGLNLKEKIFISASWISKATVQAAVGSQTLDYGRFTQKDEPFLNYANQVLTLSVLSILLTAPLGAALLDILGPRLLRNTQTCVEVPDDERDYNNKKRTTPVDQNSRNYGSCSQPESTKP